jgi:hypothetical protein
VPVLAGEKLREHVVGEELPGSHIAKKLVTLMRMVVKS